MECSWRRASCLEPGRVDEPEIATYDASRRRAQQLPGGGGGKLDVVKRDNEVKAPHFKALAVVRSWLCPRRARGGERGMEG